MQYTIIYYTCVFVYHAHRGLTKSVAEKKQENCPRGGITHSKTCNNQPICKGFGNLGVAILDRILPYLTTCHKWWILDSRKGSAGYKSKHAVLLKSQKPRGPRTRSFSDLRPESFIGSKWFYCLSWSILDACLSCFLHQAHEYRWWTATKPSHLMSQQDRWATLADG